MKLKLMTLNLWGYFDWNNREENLLQFLREETPDVVALQEVQLNSYFSNVSQVEKIAQELGYKYFAYSPVWGRTEHMQYDEHKETRLSHGLGFMSKFPILSVESYFLLQQPNHDEPYNIQLIQIDINGNNQLFCNIHFGNSDTYSQLHLEEVTQLCRVREILPIMLGDFNNFNLEQFKNTLLKDYTLSTEISTYESMPKDKGTLDYIITPKNIIMTSVSCAEIYLSDHRAITTNLLIQEP